jgi:hypothetical protein
MVACGGLAGLVLKQQTKTTRVVMPVRLPITER